MREPIHELVVELRASGFAITSATPHVGGRVTPGPIDPIMRITSPDGLNDLYVRESVYFRDPEGATHRVRLILRGWGYPT